jgi:hypothetical protein
LTRLSHIGILSGKLLKFPNDRVIFLDRGFNSPIPIYQQPAAQKVMDVKKFGERQAQKGGMNVKLKKPSSFKEKQIDQR